MSPNCMWVAVIDAGLLSYSVLSPICNIHIHWNSYYTSYLIAVAVRIQLIVATMYVCSTQVCKQYKFLATSHSVNRGGRLKVWTCNANYGLQKQMTKRRADIKCPHCMYTTLAAESIYRLADLESVSQSITHWCHNYLQTLELASSPLPCCQCCTAWGRGYTRASLIS